MAAAGRIRCALAGCLALMAAIMPLPDRASAETGAQLSLVREGDLVAIGGVLPDEATRDALVAALRAAGGDISTIDTTEIRADAPATFREGAAWAGSVIARLKPGAVLLTGTALTVEGRPDGLGGAEAVRAALAALPAGFTLQREALMAPIVSPFALTLVRSGDTVRMDGVVASPEEGAAIAAFARSLGLAPEGSTTVAAGAPAGIDWAGAARFGLVQLARLKAGEVRIADRALSVTGEAADRAGYVAVNRALRDGPGASVGVSIASVAIAAAVVSPYRWAAVKRDGRLLLRGYVSSEAERAEIRAAAEALAAPAQIVDEQELASGAPQGFVTAVVAGIGHLTLVEAGEARVEGTSLLVTGRVPDAASEAAARAAITGSVPFGFTATATLTAPAAPPPPPAPPACLAVVAAELAQGGIAFRISRDVMEPASQARLDRVAQAMATCPRVRFTIAGHTDSDGIAAQNVDLSQRRAQAVVAHLIRRGVEAGRLLAEGHGATRPLAPNDSAANKARNRRIEITAR